MNASLPVFLSAYDPAELPGGSVDPLGFTAGYLVLADTLFPGMTAAANQATYFPMLCAGLWIADAHGGAGGSSVAGARKRRIEVGLRFERLWALACALQIEGEDGERDNQPEAAYEKIAGLRGITYVDREIERLTRAGAKEAGTRFSLLAQQYRYGAFGIYSGVAEALRLLEKAAFAPTPGFGDAIGQSYLETTSDASERKELVRAAVDASATIRLSTLRTWGARAHAGAQLQGQARALLREAVVHDPERARMLAVLEGVWGEWTGEWSDRDLLGACITQAQFVEATTLRAALEAALAYDAFLRRVTLTFERVLWLCRKSSDAENTGAVFADPIVVEACGSLGERAGDFLARSEALTQRDQGELRKRGRSVVELAQGFVGRREVASNVRAVIQRHARIQGSKFEHGRPKQAWIEERGSEFALTSSRIGTRSSGPERPEDVRAPDWRVRAALSLLQAVGSVNAARAT